MGASRFGGFARRAARPLHSQPARGGCLHLAEHGADGAVVAGFGVEELAEVGRGLSSRIAGEGEAVELAGFAARAGVAEGAEFQLLVLREAEGFLWLGGTQKSERIDGFEQRLVGLCAGAEG